MQRFFSHGLVAAAAGVALLAACGGNGAGVPGGIAGSQQPAGAVRPAATINLSGDYSGYMKDDKGTTKFKLSLSQEKASLGGGSMTSPSGATGDISWTVSGASVAGTSVAFSPSGYCTFTETGMYDSKTDILSGSYKAVYGCSGQKGTYRLKHQCFFRGTVDEDVLPAGGGKPC
jgi:hypothetical protein